MLTKTSCQKVATSKIESFRIKMTKQTLPLEPHWTASQLNPSDSWTWHTSPNAEIKCLVGTKSIILSNVYFSCMSNYHCYEKNHSFHYPVFFPSVCTVADPDLQIRGGSSRSWDKGRARSPKKFFWPFGPHFGQKMGGGLSPRSATAAIPPQSIIHWTFVGKW